VSGAPTTAERTSAAGQGTRGAVALRRAMLVVNVLGIALAAYLTYIHYAGLNPICTLGNSCIRVQTSVWSKLDGVPVALIGLIGYVAILLSQLVGDREQTRLATLGLAVIGFAFSAYLAYREIFSIHAICEECMTSFGLVTLLMIGAAIRYLTAPTQPPPPTAEQPPPPRARAPA
jgi:uncharacterized membrane protein